MLRTLTVLLAMLCIGACTDQEKERLTRTTRPTYDPVTGRLKELTYDADRDGRIDTWTAMDGTRPLSSRIDRDGDGRIDRWEYYGTGGELLKIGFSLQNNGRVDAWAFAAADGKVQTIEMSSAGDEHAIDRREFYDTARKSTQGSSALVGAELDTDADGKIDRWESYEDGALRTVAFDENADGVADRRMTYHGGTLAVIESEPDRDGRFTSTIAIRP
jgi:hypothetical protein